MDLCSYIYLCLWKNVFQSIVVVFCFPFTGEIHLVVTSRGYIRTLTFYSVDYCNLIIF